MTLQEAITKVRYQLLEEYPGYWTDDELKSYINEGNLLFHSQRGIDTEFYVDIPDNTDRVHRDARAMNIRELYYTPTGSSTKQKIEIDSDDNYLYFSPALNAGRLTWRGQRLPNVVENSDDVIEINPAFEPAIINFATYKAMLKDNDGRSNVYFSNFVALKRQWENFGFRPKYKINVVKGG